MAALDFLRLLPVFSIITWFTLAGVQVLRDRTRTRTERFFLLACVFTGLYAASDLAFFNTTSPDAARTLVRLSVTSITFAAVFFFMFTQVYMTRSKRWHFALLGPPILLIPLIWTGMIQNVVLPDPEGLFIPIFDPLAFVVWLVVIVAYSLTGIINVYRLHKIVRVQSRMLARRVAGVLVTLGITFALGLSTNGYLGATQNAAVPPPFSSLLVIPGIFAALALYPLRRERISEVMRRFKAKRYQIESGFLVYGDGTLIGSTARAPEDRMDQDLFSATLDVIQNFMRTSFPVFAGKSLRTIEHGDLKILIERGRSSYLAVVLTGEENDLLRRQMRDELLGFEEKNRAALKRWSGDPEDAVGVDDMFRRFLEPATMFPR